MIKLKSDDLKHKSSVELEGMKTELLRHLFKAQAPKNVGEIGFNINEEKKNIARINTILKQNEKN